MKRLGTKEIDILRHYYGTNGSLRDAERENGSSERPKFHTENGDKGSRSEK